MSEEEVVDMTVDSFLRTFPRHETNKENASGLCSLFGDNLREVDTLHGEYVNGVDENTYIEAAMNKRMGPSESDVGSESAETQSSADSVARDILLRHEVHDWIGQFRNEKNSDQPFYRWVSKRNFTERLAWLLDVRLFLKFGDTRKEYPTMYVFEVVLPVLLSTPAGRLPRKINDHLNKVFPGGGADGRVLNEKRYREIETNKELQWALIDAIKLFGKIDVVRREEEDDDERITHICISLTEF